MSLNPSNYSSRTFSSSSTSNTPMAVVEMKELSWAKERKKWAAQLNRRKVTFSPRYKRVECEVSKINYFDFFPPLLFFPFFCSFLLAFILLPGWKNNTTNKWNPWTTQLLPQPSGFMSWIDINECEIDNGNCSNGTSTCVNTNGGFFCSCLKEYIPSDDDKYKCIREYSWVCF